MTVPNNNLPSDKNEKQEPAGATACTALPGGVTLETIIDMTGELEHLNELVLLHLDQEGGFAGAEAYFATVRPVLDRLEDEIRINYRPGMSTEDLKVIICTWIDFEICSLQ